ncbi:ATP-binding cassette domain-containing protein (plasmid) [Rhizobium sp. RCAM05350]|uniref:ATP-binding cassette domain-containing protein n=1 Tax=Rhizobium sp. RCAM05350 TaxID=2895568 RepID=UPI002076710D|nr:ATP-binding cassette domain-containing protein [Rhizobium sp. RCAM05350]URK89431.1 ATP-binding cassette domain-containing protein [Rhizobium sp. RCAM05350]
MDLGSAAGKFLENISFDLHAGEILAVVGESGSGKSTLLKGIMGLVAADSGSIALNGQILPSGFKQHDAVSVEHTHRLPEPGQRT